MVELHLTVEPNLNPNCLGKLLAFRCDCYDLLKFNNFVHWTKGNSVDNQTKLFIHHKVNPYYCGCWLTLDVGRWRHAHPEPLLPPSFSVDVVVARSPSTGKKGIR